MLDTETKKRIDTARDILVGKVPDPKSQVEQITIALIYKFMDDMDNEAVAMGGKATFFAAPKKTGNKNEDEKLTDFSKYKWKNIFDPKIGGHEMLQLYAEAITNLNLNPNIPQLFRDIFKNAYLPYRDPETLKMFLKTINEFSYDHSEMLGDAFEYLLSVLGSQGDAGQFRTPRHIIDFIVEVLQPKKNETICDPACGTAGFLISSYKHILKNNTKKNKGDLLTPTDRNKMMQNFVGYDISPDMVRLSLVNMYLHGFTTPSIFEYDTLTSEERWNEYFDVIIANPPFMSPKGGIKPHKKFTVQANRSEVLFVDYIAEHIHPSKGRAGIIVPEGIIFQSGTAYKALRKMLVDKHYLYAVVSLPAGIFQPYSGVKTSILLMDRTLAKKTDNILFVKIESDGFDLGAQRRAIENNDLTGCLELLQGYKTALQENKSFKSDNKNVFLVEKEKIAATPDYNLSIDRYRVNDNARSSTFEMVKLGDETIFKIESGGTPDTSVDSYWNGSVDWATLADLPQKDFITEIISTKRKISSEGLKNSSAKLVPINSILVSSRATIGRIGINKIALATNQGFKIIIVKDLERALPQFVALMMTMLKDEMESLATGGTFKEISKSNFSNLQIPLPQFSVQQQIVSKIESYQKIIDGAKQVVENYKPQIEMDEGWEMVELGSICDSFQYGSSEKSNDSGTIPCLRMGNIQNGEIDWNDLKYAPAHEDFEKYMLRENDVLFNRTNSPIHVGKTAIYRGKKKAVFAGYLIRINYQNDRILGSYLNYCLNSQEAKVFCQRVKTDGINQSNINAKILATFQLPLPSIEEQEKIVLRIEEEQGLVDSNKKLIEIFEHKIKDEIGKLWQSTPADYKPSETELLLASEE